MKPPFRRTALTVALALVIAAPCRRPEPAPPTTLAWKWSSGQVRRYRLQVAVERSVAIRQRGQTGLMASSDRGEQVWRLSATDVAPNGNAALELTCESIRQSIQEEFGPDRTDFDSTNPNDSGLAKPFFKEKSKIIGIPFRATMLPWGDLSNGTAPDASAERISTSAENIIFNFHTDARIVVESFNALFARVASSEPIPASREWDWTREVERPGIGSTEFSIHYKLADLNSPRTEIVRIIETLTWRLKNADARKDHEDGDPENDPFLLHQKLVDFGGEGSGEMRFDVGAGHIQSLTETLTDTSTFTTGKEAKKVTTTLELLPR